MIYVVFMRGWIGYLVAEMMQVNKTLLVMLLCSCALAPSPQASAATLYVDTQNPSARDSNPGTQSQPWKTIQKAASTAAAGDTVIVKAGEYNEFVTNQVSGTAGNPITFTGVRGGNGAWLTIIDPSTPFTNGWVTAPEIGSGVYKQTNMAFTTRELTINNQRVGFVWTNGDMSGDINSAYTTTNTTGFQFLALPSDATLTSRFNGSAVVTFWDGVEALYCSTGSVTYLRLRDGSSPNGLNVRAAPNYVANPTDLVNPAVKIVDKSYLVWSNVLVRGAAGGFFIYNANSHHNTIESNYISGGQSQITVGPHAHDNLIRNNEVTGNFYGYSDPGAWQNGSTIRENLYLLSKFLMGQGSTFEYGIALIDCGASNVVSGNHVFKGLGSGIELWNYLYGYTPQTNSLVFGNTIENQTSVGVMFSEGQVGTQFYDNHVSDCNLNMRFHHLDVDVESNRLVYIYRNTYWLPNGVGDHVFMFADNNNGTTDQPTFWVYHNSFSGGAGAVSDNGYAVDNGGHTNIHFLNNVFSGMPYFNTSSIGLPFWTNSAMMGLFDYNLVMPPAVTYPSATNPAWFGAHNIRRQTAEWVNNVAMTFQLTDLLGLNAAIDVTKPFSIGGTTYPALPVTAAQKVGSGWDMGALEYSIPPPVLILRDNSPGK